jgi:hypothetical protein
MIFCETWQVEAYVVTRLLGGSATRRTATLE